MRLFPALASAVLTAALLGAPAAASAAPTGSLHYLDVEVPGADYTAVTGINDDGVLVGYYGNASGRHGFIQSRGRLTTVDVPGTDNTALTSINDLGTTTGTYLTEFGGRERSFLRDARGRFTWLDDPNAAGPSPRGTVASAVNGSGTVVGWSFTTQGDSVVFHGFVWKHGRFTAYDAPGSATSGPSAVGTQLFGVNGAGTIVGRSSYLDPDRSPDEAILVSRRGVSTYVDPRVPTNFCGFTHFQAIDDHGTIAGNSGNGCGHEFFAWLKNGDALTPVAYPGATATTVNGLSGGGVVVGSWRVDTSTPDGYVEGPEHGFVGVPG